MALLFESMQSLGTKMETRVRHLEAQVREGFEMEGRHGKQDCENFDKKMMTKMEDGVQNEENASWFKNSWQS